MKPPRMFIISGCGSEVWTIVSLDSWVTQKGSECETYRLLGDGAEANGFHGLLLLRGFDGRHFDSPDGTKWCVFRNNVDGRLFCVVVLRNCTDFRKREEEGWTKCRMWARKGLYPLQYSCRSPGSSTAQIRLSCSMTTSRRERAGRLDRESWGTTIGPC